MFSKRRSFLVALLGLSVWSAHAATINVGAGQPYPTIQSGISAANSGDTVLVAPGTYIENIDFKGKAITVASSGGAATTIIDGGIANQYPAVNFSSGEGRTSVFSGFTVRGGGGEPTPGNQLGGINASGASPTIENNVVTANLCSGIYVQYGAPLIQGNTVSAVVPLNIGRTCTYTAGIAINGTAGSGPQVLGNTVTQNVDGTAGILLNAADGTLIQGNTITGNQKYGVFSGNTDKLSLIGNIIAGNSSGPTSYPANQPSGVYILAPAAGGSTVGPFLGIIAGNTITDTLELDGNLAQFVVANNIIAGSSATTPPMQCAYSGPLAITPPSFDHNDIWNSAGAAYGGTTGFTASATCPDQTGSYGNISADPRFVSASTGNYQLAAGSPAIDAGNSSAPSLPAVDFTGAARIQNGGSASYPIVDMGAFEFAGTPDTGHTVITLTPSEYFTSVNQTPVPQPLSLTAALSAASSAPVVFAPPTGYIAFYEDSTLLGTVATTSSGVATLVPGTLARGLHAFTAVYPAPNSGTANPVAYATPATSVNFFLLVPNDLTTIEFSASPRPAHLGDTVLFTVTLSLPNATVLLTDTSTNTLLGTPATNAQGVATFPFSTLAVGTHNIVATYPGNAGESGATASLTEIVNPAATTSTLSIASPASGTVTSGTPVTLAANVAATTGGLSNPTGAVYFYDNVGNTSSLLGSASVSGGVAMLTVPGLPVGPNNLSCLYQGDGNFAASTCSTIVLNVVPPAPQTITFPQPPATAYAVTAVALAATSSSGLPVTYTVVSGPASVAGTTLTYLGAGTVVVQADQAGNGNYAAAPSVQDTINVTLLTQPLTVASSSVNTLVTFLQAGTLASITATSQGAANGEFNVAAGGTCGVGTAYAAGQTCTANFTFVPLHPGLRFGGIAFTSGSGSLLANSYVLGYGTGPQILYNPPNQTNVGKGFGGLSGVAVDGSGNVYAADLVGNGIFQVSAATGATRLLASVTSPVDVAVDGSGNVFYGSRHIVYEALAVNGALPASPTIRTLSSGYGELDGLKVDAAGNVFLADGVGSTGTSAIYEILAVNGSVPASPTVRTLESGTGVPTGVAIDVIGDVFFSSQYDHAVYELKAVNGTIPASAPVVLVNNSFGEPTNVTFDVSGNLYVPDYLTHDVKELLAVNGVLPANPTILSRGTGLGEPNGATVDAGGNIFVADGGLGQVVELAYGNAPTLPFAPTVVGQTSSDSPKALTLTNGGNADLVFAPLPHQANPHISIPNFGIDSSSTCPVLSDTAAGRSVAAGASCTYAINFTPTVQGSITGTLILYDNNLGVANAHQQILLQGNGVGIAPTIVFTVPNHTFGDPPFPVAATSNSAGAFTYSVVSGPASIGGPSGSIVTLTGAGTVTLLASQAASGIYAAGTATATFQVAKMPQTITFPAPASPVAFGVAPITLSATATSGLPVAFSVISGPGQISGNILVVTGGGAIVIAADQPGNASYAAAPQVRQTILVNYGPATVVLTATPNPVFLSNPLALNAVVTGGGGQATGTVTFKEGNAVLGAGTLAGGSTGISISTLTVGPHIVTAYYNGDGNFAAVAGPSVTVIVQDFSLTITNPNVTIIHGGAGVFNIVVSTIGGVGLAESIQLSMAGGPNNSTHTFSQSTVTTGSGTAALTLTVQTPNYPVGPFGSLARSTGGVSFALLSLAGAGLGLWRKRRRFGRGASLFALLLLLGSGAGASLLLGGCGAGWRTQGWNLSVTATSGSLSRTAAATLTSECKDGQEICPIYK